MSTSRQRGRGLTTTEAEAEAEAEASKAAAAAEAAAVALFEAPAEECPARRAKVACAACGGPRKSKCSRCGIVRYCGRQCQAEHWKSHHKPLCVRLERLRAGEEESRQDAAAERRSFEPTAEWFLLLAADFLNYRAAQAECAKRCDAFLDRLTAASAFGATLHLQPKLAPWIRAEVPPFGGRGQCVTVSASYYDEEQECPAQIHKLLYKVVDPAALASNVSPQEVGPILRGSALAVKNATAEVKAFQAMLEGRGIEVASITAGPGLHEAFGGSAAAVGDILTGGARPGGVGAGPAGGCPTM